MMRTLVLAFMLVAAPLAAASLPTAEWTVEEGFLVRRFDGERTRWRLDRLSWLSFVAWEEARLGGSAVEAWVDTPGNLSYVRTKNARVITVRAFAKGQRIPDDLRPAGRKILWVVLDDELVRKVYEDGKVTFEWRYPKTRIPLFPYVAAQEAAKGGALPRRAVISLADRETELVVGAADDVPVTTWKKGSDGFSLPPAGTAPLERPTPPKVASRPPSPQPKPTPAPGPVAPTKSVTPTKSASRPPSPPPPTRKPAPPLTPRPPSAHRPAGALLPPPKGQVLPRDPASRAELFLAQGQGAEALAVLEPLLKARPKDAELLALSGRALVLLDRLDEASRRFERARSLAPGRPGPILGAAEVLVARGRGADALRLLDELTPGVAPAAAERTRAAALLVSRDAAGARRAAASALSHEPDHPGSLFLLARAAELAGDAGAARDGYRAVLMAALPGTLAFLPPSLATLAPEGSTPAGFQPLRLGGGTVLPLYYAAAFRLGLLEARVGNVELAAEAFTQAHLAEPAEPAALFDCAVATSRIPGRSAEARSLLVRLLGSEPTYDPAREALATLGADPTPTGPVRSDPTVDDRFDRLYQAVSSRAAGKPAAVSRRLRPSSSPTLTLIDLHEGSGTDERVRPLAPDRTTLPEFRAGGAGEAPGPQGATVRLTARLDAPPTVDPEPAMVGLRLQGTVSPGEAREAVLELSLMAPDGSLRGRARRRLPRVDTGPSPVDLELSGLLPLQGPGSCDLLVVVSLALDADAHTEILRRLLRLHYRTTTPSTDDGSDRP